MNKAAHNKKRPPHRARVGAIAAACLLAVIAIVVGVGVSGNNSSSPASSATGVTDTGSPNAQGQASASNISAFIPDTQNAATSGQVAESASAESATVELVPTAPQIVVENPTFPDTSTPVTVEDEGLPAHQQSVALVTLPEGTTRAQLQEMLANAPYVDASKVTDDDLKMGLVLLTVADGVALTDAINALEHIPGIDGAQPNFVYTIADESQGSASTDTSVFSTSSSESQPPANPARSTSGTEANADSDEPDAPPSADAAASHESPSAASSTSGSTSSTSASSAADSNTSTADEFIVSIAAAINDAYALSENNYWHLESINAFDAWSQLGYSNANDANPIGIAIIDTGANTNHEDLKDRIVATYNSYDASSSTLDYQGHGTHVAGIAAATANNGIGVAGVSYNSNLVIIKAATSQSGKDFSTTSIANAYTWLLSDSDGNGKTVAQEHNVRVINMSIGGYNESSSADPTMDTVLTRKIDAALSEGILTVCAAGNSPISDGAGNAHSAPYVCYPGDYPSVLSVINLNHNSSSSANDAASRYYVERHSSSNYNLDTTTESSTFTKDISAPGTNILSTSHISDNRSYKTDTGTSMASPIVAGVAALIYEAGNQAGKTLSANDVRNAIQNRAHDLGDEGWDIEYGYGEVDAGAAVKSIFESYVSGSTLVGTNETSGEEVYKINNPGSSTWTWSSSNTGAATIDADTGVLTPRAAGTTLISATNGTTTRSLAITVIDPSITCTECGSIRSGNGILTCSDPRDKLSYVWGYDNVTYSIVENGASSAWDWKWSGTAGASVSGTIGSSTGILRTESPNLDTASTLTITATCTSNPNIKITKDIAVKPLPNMSGVSSIFSGLGAQFSLSNVVESDAWTWSVSNAGASITSQDSDSCVIKTDENIEGTATLVATLDHTEYSRDITISKAAIIGNASIAANSSTIYYLANAQYSVTWKATINDEDLDESIAKFQTGYINAERYPAAQITAVGKSSSPIILTATISDSLGNTINCERSIYIISGDLSKLDVDIVAENQVYSGSAQTPTPVVTISGVDDSGNPWSTELTPQNFFTSSYADYKVTEYKNNVNAGTATITIEGVNSYTGTATGTFTIEKRDMLTISNSTVSAQTYTGSQIAPAPNLYFTVPDFLFFSHNVNLTKGTDYEVSYGTNVNAGTGTIVYTGKGNYTGTKTVTFTISRASIAVPSAKTGLIYTGSSQTGVASGNGYALSGTTSATNAGTHTAYATPDSNHQWTDGSYTRKAITWTIARRSLSNAAVSGSYTYTGSAIRPSVKVTASGASGSPTYSTAYSNNVNAGTGSITVTGTGNYMGSITRNFTINRRNIAEANISAASQTYTGGAITPKPTVTWNGRTLSNGSDYTTSYANNTNVGTATVTANGTGNFTGSTSTSFEIVASGVPMYRLYNPNSGEHFYTADAGERNNLTRLGWNYEGVGWTAPSMSASPVYRMYNANGGEHHYTMDAGERDMLVGVGWSYEGVGWYSDDSQRVPLYRDYNPNAFANNHNYTASAAEHDMLMGAGWRSEGYAWYGM